VRLQRPWLLAVSIVIGLIVLLVLYGAFLAWRIEKSLTRADDDAHALEAAVRSGDTAAITRSANAFRADVATAHGHAHNPVWSLSTHLPFFGDDARGVQVVTDVGQNLSANGLGDLATAASQIDQLLPKGGAVDLHVVQTMQAPVANGDVALQQAQAALHGQDPSGFIDGLKTRYRSLEDEVDRASTAMTSADRALQVLPTMLGGSGPKNYLVVFYNNAEIRAGGGLPGAVTLLHADQGHLTLAKETSGKALGEAKQPVLPLSSAEKQLWDQQLGTYFLDANFTPDFDRTADLMRARWEQVEGDKVDGVLALDPVTLSYVLKATGPITVDGVQLSADNAVSYLLHQIYIDRPQPAAQDAFFADVAREFFAKVTGGAGSPQGVIEGLAQGTGEHRVDLHSFDASVQKVLDGTQVAGQLPMAATTEPQEGFYLNDTTGAKMSYYLRYDVNVAATYCTSGVQGLSGDATVSSTAPADAATSLPPYITGGGVYGTPPGQQLVTVFVFGPVGGKITGLAINDKKQTDYTQVDYEGRPVAETYLQLKPGQSYDVTWTATTGAGQTGDVHTQVTPSVVAGTSSSVTPSACGR
jgi:hypothetical protein